MKPKDVAELFIDEIRSELGTDFSTEEIPGFLTTFSEKYPKEFSFLNTHELVFCRQLEELFARYCDESDSFISMMRGDKK